VSHPFNSPTRGGLSRIVKFLAHNKVSWVGFIHFQPSWWWANPCEPGWLTLTCLISTYTDYIQGKPILQLFQKINIAK